jgi:hypothetical protein
VSVFSWPTKFSGIKNLPVNYHSLCCRKQFSFTYDYLIHELLTTVSNEKLSTQLFIKLNITTAGEKEGSA